MNDDTASILASLTAILPLDHAMAELVPLRRQKHDAVEVADKLATELAETPCLAAGVWLYVDDLDRSHRISQDLHSTEGSLWHAVMHRREGDFGNSKYWLRQAGDVAILNEVYGDPYAFVVRVQREHRQNPPELIALQRKEWVALFTHCMASRTQEGVT